MLVTQHRLLWSKCLEDTDDAFQSYHPVSGAASGGFTDMQPNFQLLAAILSAQERPIVSFPDPVKLI
jgi:hypothetical protein